MNDTDDNCQMLMRLKRYETPGEQYFEDFLTEFQARRTEESSYAQQPSPFDQWKAKVNDWYQELGYGKWAVPAGSFAAIAITVFALAAKQSHEASEVKHAASGEQPQTEEATIEVKLPNVPMTPGTLPNSGSSYVLPASTSGAQ